MRFLRYSLLAAVVLAAAPAAAQSGAHPTPGPAVSAHRATDIVLDGRLDEAVWATPDPATGFRQQEPAEGEPGSRTEVRFAYDDGALYVGARMYDSLGVSRQLARRDADVESDWIQLVFDTYHDHASRTILQVNPSGVKYDAGQASPSADPSWDPVWEVETKVDSLGWTAEMRIPWSQLRFSDAVDQRRAGSAVQAQHQRADQLWSVVQLQPQRDAVRHPVRRPHRNWLL